jgi:hypothetical protein
VTRRHPDKAQSQRLLREHGAGDRHCQLNGSWCPDGNQARLTG